MSESTVAHLGVEGFLKKLRRTHFFKDHVPLGMSCSLPIVSTRKPRVSVSFFLYGTESVDQGLTILAPFAYLSMSYPSGRVIRYIDRSHYPDGLPEPGTNLGVFPHDAIRALRPSEYASRRKALMKDSDALLEGEEPTSRLLELWAELAEPCLAAFYRSLDPEFFKRVDALK